MYTIKQLDSGKWVVVNFFGEVVSVPTWDAQVAMASRDQFNREYRAKSHGRQ